MDTSRLQKTYLVRKPPVSAVFRYMKKENRKRQHQEKQNQERQHIEKQNQEKQHIEKQNQDKQNKDKQHREKQKQVKQHIEKQNQEKQHTEKQYQQKQHQEKQNQEKQHTEKQYQQKQNQERQHIEKQYQQKQHQEKQNQERQHIEKQNRDKQNEEKKSSNSQGEQGPRTSSYKFLSVIQEPNNISYNFNVNNPNFIPKYKESIKKMNKSFDQWKRFFEKYPSSRNYDVMLKTTRILNEALDEQKSRNRIYNKQEKMVYGTECIPLKALEKRALKMKTNKTKNRKRLGDFVKFGAPKMKK